MERWIGKVAVVTGASSGIGAAIAVDLVRAGLIVVGLARRQARVEALREKLAGAPGVLHSRTCDVCVEADINETFAWIEANLGPVDILVNNAGTARQTSLIEPNNSVAILEVLNTNVMGVVLCTREAFQSMKRHNVAGHIVIINSILGHMVPYLVGQTGSRNIYPPSKYAVTAMTEVLRQEFQAEGTKVKISVDISGGIFEQLVKICFYLRRASVLEL